MAAVSFSTFAGQNWLITPVALAVNEPRPPSIVDQKWHIEFSGVGVFWISRETTQMIGAAKRWSSFRMLTHH